MTNETKEFLFEFLDNEVTTGDFEQWIYKNNELETSQPTLYQDLILSDFGDTDVKNGIKNKLGPYIDSKEFNVWRTKRLLNKIIENKIDIVLGTRKLRELYFETGENFIPPTLGIGFESELDDLPTPDEYHMWNEKELKEKLKKADRYKEDIKRDAEAFLTTLKS
jgi:hypothetical protein